ncbi:MAG TPA: hypothetical protein P5532_12830 [Planctomycetota bacterium]|nr:hypothetical protein [Planctomycetota bacterium]HRT95305.1 hypothetical protein [Planctomycetota bacterium]
MLRDYVKGPKPAPAQEPLSTPAAPANPMREFQIQWGKMLTRCYDLYAEGKRCVHEEDPAKRLDCTHCEHREGDGFCRSNFYLKKLVGLIAEYLAEQKMARGATTPQDAAPGDAGEADATEAPPLTQAQLDEFKAQGVCYEVQTSLCKEPVWIVPRRTGKPRLEFTVQEVHFMAQAAKTLEGTLVEIVRSPSPSPTPSLPERSDE